MHLLTNPNGESNRFRVPEKRIAFSGARPQLQSARADCGAVPTASLSLAQQEQQ